MLALLEEGKLISKLDSLTVGVKWCLTGYYKNKSNGLSNDQQLSLKLGPYQDQLLGIRTIGPAHRRNRSWESGYLESSLRV